jgi:large subunit ribosomal protein L32e
MTKEALAQRTSTKKRKPNYKRAQSTQFSKLKAGKWRRPKGMGNKNRRNRKGHIGMLKVGFGSPKSIKGFNKAGFEEVLVSTVAELAKIDTKTQQAVIKSSVGAKKRIEILKEAQAKKLTLANVADISNEIEKLSKKAPEKKEKKQEKKETSPEKKEETKEEAKK